MRPRALGYGVGGEACGQGEGALTQLVHGTAVFLVKRQLHHRTGGLADLRLDGDRAWGTRGPGQSPPSPGLGPWWVPPLPAFSTLKAGKDPSHANRCMLGT